MYRSSHPEVFCKKVALRKFTRKHLWLHSKRNSGSGVFKKTFFIEYLRAAASKYNVTFQEVFSLIHRTLKRKRCLNMLFAVYLSFYDKLVF